MALVQVVYLPFRRKQFHKMTFHFLSRLPKRIKDQIVVHILDSDAQNAWTDRRKLLDANGVQSMYTQVDAPRDHSAPNNYMSKISRACCSTLPYSIKLDEDCFMNEFVWEYWIDRIPRVLNDPNNLFLAPVLSNGIPTCEMFLDCLVSGRGSDMGRLERLYTRFKETEFKNYWGNDYTSLNEFTINDKTGTRWNPKAYWESVSSLPYYYKGVHPVRMSFESQMRINKAILNHLDSFLMPREYGLNFDTDHYPYFCNSAFAIRTQQWKEIIADVSLQRDSYDEVPLNLYREKTGKKAVFIKNGLGIHTLYGFVRQNEAEMEWYRKLEKALL